MSDTLDVVSAVAPILTTVAIVTSFIPGIDALTGTAAAIVSGINVAANVVGVASTVAPAMARAWR